MATIKKSCIMGDLKMAKRRKTCLHALSDSAITCQRRGLAKAIKSDNHS